MVLRTHKKIPSNNHAFDNLNAIIDWAERILKIVNSNEFLDIIDNGQDPFSALREQYENCPIPQLDKDFQAVNEYTQVCIFIYGCLTMLWAVHARLNIVRRNGLLKPDGTRLLWRVEKLLEQRHDDKWYEAINRFGT